MAAAWFLVLLLIRASGSEPYTSACEAHVIFVCLSLYVVRRHNAWLRKTINMHVQLRNSVIVSIPVYTNLEEVVEGDRLHLRTVDLLVVCEEEPVGNPNVKQIGVLSMLLDQFQPSLVAVPTTEEDARFSVAPGNPLSLLSRQNGE